MPSPASWASSAAALVSGELSLTYQGRRPENLDQLGNPDTHTTPPTFTERRLSPWRGCRPVVPPCPHGNLVGISGRRWLAKQVLPEDERAAVERNLAQIDLVESSLKLIEAEIAREAMSDPVIRRLMTLPGVDMTVASGRRGRDRRHPSLPGPAQTRQLPRADSQRPSIGRGTGPAWSDHQAGSGPGPRHAGGGGMGRRSIARSVPRVLPADRGPP